MASDAATAMAIASRRRRMKLAAPMDSTTSADIMQVFGELHAMGQTVIMVTHEPDIAAFAERVVVLRDGRVESDRLNRESAA